MMYIVKEKERTAAMRSREMMTLFSRKGLCDA